MENSRAEILLTSNICTVNLVFYRLIDARDPPGGGGLSSPTKQQAFNSPFSFQSERLKTGSALLSTTPLLTSHMSLCPSQLYLSWRMCICGVVWTILLLKKGPRSDKRKCWNLHQLITLVASFTINCPVKQLDSCHWPRYPPLFYFSCNYRYSKIETLLMAHNLH